MDEIEVLENTDFSSPFWAVTNANGEYILAGLPFNDYKVLAKGGNNPQYVSEWYDNQNSYQNAAVISVSIENPDVSSIIFNLAIGGSITGVIMPESGDPWLNNARVTIIDYTTGEQIAEAGTLEDNMTYLVQGIPTGSYLVMAQSQDRAIKFWQNTYNEADATPVVVTSLGVTTNINFTLSPGGRMNGRVWMSGELGTHEILPDALVTAYLLNPMDTPDEEFADMEFTTVSDENGNWEFNHLPYGDYKIGASGSVGQMVIPKWWAEYDEAYSWDEAGVIQLDYNWGWWTEFWLNPAGLVTGFVYEEDGVTAIANAEVFALRIFGSYDGPQSEKLILIANAITDTDGSYELFCPVDQGSFVVGAQAEGCVRMFFQDTFDPTEAVDFLLNCGEEIGGVSFSLGQAGTISGVVADASTSQGLDGCVVLALNESTGVDFKTMVEVDGTYTVDNLPFGEYIVMAMGMPDNNISSNYAMEWWQETACFEDATPVVVDITTQDVTQINFTLEPGGAIEGIVRHENGWDINGALVSLYLPDGTLLADTWSNGYEGYQFNGVPSGEYKISAWYIEPHGGSNTQRRFYDDQPSLEMAETVIVTAPNTTANVDFSLSQANGQISGITMYTGSLQSSDYDQIVILAQPYGVDIPPEMLYQKSIASPGGYQMYNIADGSYIIIAFLDIDGDYQPDAGEPYGFYGEPTPVTLACTMDNPYPQVPGTTIIITDEARGIISGNINLEGTDDHSGATVTAGSYQTTTNQDGSYILNVAPGTYTVTIDKAGYLAAVSSEIYVVEILSGEPVEMPDTLLLLGDANDSGTIDITDLITVTDNLDTVGPTGDLTGDGLVDILDLIPIGRNFGKTESLWLDDESGAELPQASGIPTITLVPSSQSAAPGDTITLNAVIADVSGLYSAEINVNFDQTLLQVQDANSAIAGSQITPSDDLFPFVSGAYYTAGEETLYYYKYSADNGGYFIAQCQADNNLGVINYTIVLLSPEGDSRSIPVSADLSGATLATITFDCTCTNEGETSIDFTNTPKLADITGDAINLESYTGTSVNIEIPPPEISDMNITNVGDRSFTVSWVTNVDTTGQISYGTSSDNLNSTAYDDRGQLTEDDTHHVSVTGLLANTTYYFDVVSAETTDDNNAAHYEVTTGPGLDFKMPDPITGTVYKMDGITAAEGTIIYAYVGTSQVLSGLVDSSGNWGIDIAAIRNADFQSYYTYIAGDYITINAQGSADGTGFQSETVTTSRDGAPAVTLIPNYAPAVENVVASQTTGTGTVSIEYDVYDPDEDDTSVEVRFAYLNGTSYVDCSTVTDSGTKTVTSTATHYTASWDAKADFDGHYITDAKIKVIADDGNILGSGEGISGEFILDTEGPTGTVCSAPGNGTIDIELSPNLTAAAVTDTSTPVSYYFTISTDQNFESGVQESGWLSENSWIPSIRLQAPEVDYWWKVNTRDNFGNTSESEAFGFTTLAVIPVDVQLVDGWNIVALAVEPTEGYTASTLAAAINENGGDITQVFWWNAAAGSWDFYLVNMAYGTDFNIEVGYGYLLKNTAPVTWTYWGVPLSAEYSASFAPQVANVTDRSFTVSWTSPNNEVGYIKYGTSADSLDNTAYDDRGQAVEDDTHHVTVSGLTAATPYYYEIVSGGVTYNNSNDPYEMTTGPGLDFKMPDPITGTAYKTGGVIAAEGTVIYVNIGNSQLLSALVDSSGNWGIDIAAVRTADFQSYYFYTTSDDINIEAQGGADGIATNVVTVNIAKEGAPAVEVSIAAEVSLVDGWNLIALPVEPATGYSASTMAGEINNQDGNITQVFWWNAAAGSWDFYLVDMAYGTDFNIDLGEGYLLKSVNASTWAIPGS
ncbi:MAG: fibronectin type III domain-containing protein [Dehalococcoidales bacterium]|nr:fibronectin type III domain-containing protein [Dehalococcoidales bacterium]